MGFQKKVKKSQKIVKKIFLSAFFFLQFHNSIHTADLIDKKVVL